MLNRIRISTSLFFILILCAVLQIGSNALSFWAFRSDFQNLQKVGASNLQRDTLAQGRAALLQVSTALGRAGTLTALSYPAEDIKGLMTNARDSLKQADTVFEQFATSEAESDEAAALNEKAKQSYTKWRDDLEHQATWLENNQLSDFLSAPVQESQDAFEASFTAWQQHINESVTGASEGSKRNYQMSAIIFGASTVIAILLTMGALLWSRLMLVRPLTVIRGHFESIAAGQLARPISVEGRNEISEIFSGLKEMQTSLRDTVSQVRNGSLAMHHGIGEIAEGNNDLSARTEQQAASLAQTAASMEELTVTVAQNADNARQAAKLSQNAAHTAEQGGEQTARMAHTMHEIETSSQKIGDITSVIDGIAFQTNILALNAAVEAARAGEHGRGFAVVAGEVRNLASRSADAAKEIKVLIDESVARVQQGSVLVDTASSTMADIVRSVTQVNDIMGEIASASDEQSRGIEQVAQAVSQMDQVTQQNAALVEEAAAATDALANQADHLTTMVSAFQLQHADSHDDEQAAPEMVTVTS